MARRRDDRSGMCRRSGPGGCSTERRGARASCTAAIGPIESKGAERVGGDEEREGENEERRRRKG